MVSFKATIKKFDAKGEKTGWTYIEIPADIAKKLHTENKKSFRIKGLIDQCKVEAIALLPMGGGNYILALNAAIRKGIKKKPGAILSLSIERDTSEITLPLEMQECLDDDPDAAEWFAQMKKGERNYFIKWITAAKSENTRAKRMAMAMNAFAAKMDFGTMIRHQKNHHIT